VPGAVSKDRHKDDVTVRLLATFKRLILEGTITAGTRLSPERELAAKFKVSRSSLRQVLKVLEIIGVISQRVGDGTYVNHGASTVLAESLEFLILLNGISFKEVMEARIIVEPELAARAAARSTAKDHAALRHEMEAMKKAGRDHETISQRDLTFHRIIFDAAGNRVCSLLFTAIHHTLHQLIELTSQLVSVNHTMRFHQRIYAAIVRGDADEARKQMTDHLLDVNDLLCRASDEQQRARVESRISELAAQPAPRKRNRS